MLLTLWCASAAKWEVLLVSDERLGSVDGTTTGAPGVARSLPQREQQEEGAARRHRIGPDSHGCPGSESHTQSEHASAARP